MSTMADQQCSEEPQQQQKEFEIKTLGECSLESPLECVSFSNGSRVFLQITDENSKDRVLLERAGPRRKLYFNPKTIRVGIVTCGGLCPGINNVVRAVVNSLYYRYGVRDIIGFKYGYDGLNPKTSERVQLDPEVVKNIDEMGGTVLGTSRTFTDPEIMVQFLVDNKVDILFTVGGDGTLRGALSMAQIIEKKKLNICIMGIPKTIDNDICYMERTFGFETAVNNAVVAIKSAYTEAASQDNTIGLVKLMGRDSGFIALYAAVASSDVHLLLIPEVKFSLEKVCAFVEEKLKTRRRCIIVVAEGAGQELMTSGPLATDASGANKKFEDIGLFLKKKLSDYLGARKVTHNIKYIDPSYIIRSSPANAGDCIFCIELAQMAVHAALAGKTGMAPGLVNGYFVHLPLKKITEKRKQVNPDDMFYQIMLDNSGMPSKLV